MDRVHAVRRSPINDLASKENLSRLRKIALQIIHVAAVEEGMLDLKMYSAWLIRQGLTTVEEVLQVVSVQE